SAESGRPSSGHWGPVSSPCCRSRCGWSCWGHWCSREILQLTNVSGLIPPSGGSIVSGSRPGDRPSLTPVGHVALDYSPGPVSRPRAALPLPVGRTMRSRQTEPRTMGAREARANMRETLDIPTVALTEAFWSERGRILACLYAQHGPVFRARYLKTEALFLI